MIRARLLLCLAWFLVGVASVRAAPNVILIVADDQGYGDMACHGNPWLKTPNLDRLHAESVCLEDYHVDPVCTPTRAALMTGRFCTRVGAWTVTEGRQVLYGDEKTMADVFVASGYRTGMFGKWHLGDSFPFAPQHRGFQDVVCHRAGGVDEIGNPTGNDYFDDIYFRNGVPEKFTGYCTEVWFREALRFIGTGGRSGQSPTTDRPRPAARPFFLYLPLNAMHSPFRVAENYWQPYAAQGIPEERAKFFGMIANFDENLGRLLDALRDAGLERDTIVIFMGDNGTAAGANGRGGLAEDGFNAGMRGKKGSVYEGGHRVGCFVRWPARLRGGVKVEQLVSHHNWLPTLIEWCGLTAPAEVRFDGRSIAPLLEGKGTKWPERTLFVQRQGNRVQKGTVERKDTDDPHWAVLTERWRLVNSELYDIAADPGQAKDIAAKHPDVVQRLFAAYESHFEDAAPRRANTLLRLGAPQENPTTLTVRDWQPTEGKVIWKPEQLSDDTLFINGFWTVHAVRAGRYAIRLSRFPDDAMQPMGASEAWLRIGDTEQRKPIDPSDVSATFHVDLPIGAMQVNTALKDARTGKERGAYHVSVRFLSVGE